MRTKARGIGSSALTLLLLFVVSGSLLAMGTVHVPVLVTIAPFALASGALAIWLEDESWRRVPAAALVAVGLSIYSLAQSLPLPMRWLQRISPVAAQTWTDVHLLLGIASTRWASVSVDPGASRVEALKWLSYAAVFTAAARLARQKSGQRGVLIVAGSALLAGVLSIAHGLFGVSEWFGVYQPQAGAFGWAAAPFVNPNNFAGYLNLALFSGMGLLFLRKPPAPRWVIGSAIVMLAALVILTGSRGGVLALLVGFASCGMAYRTQQSRAASRHGDVAPTWLPLTVVGIAATTLAAIGATSTIWQQLLDESTAKLRIIEYSQPVIRDHIWFGVGRGSFETAFAAYRRVPGHHITQFAENFPVQWIVEWGLPVALLALFGFGVTLRPRRFGFARRAVPTGIYVGLFVLLLQNLVDLGTEVASVGVATFVLLGSAVGAAAYVTKNRKRSRTGGITTPRTGASRPLVSHSRAPTTVALVFLSLGGALVYLVALTGQPNAITDRTRLATRFATLANQSRRNVALSDLRADVGQAVLRHPADPYLPVLGAWLTRESGRTPFAWVNHALRRDPLNSQPHILLAETLAARGALAQAMLELRLALEYAPEAQESLADSAIRWCQNVDVLLGAVPEGRKGVPMLIALAARLGGKPEHALMREVLLQKALQRDGRDVRANAILAHDLLTAIHAGTGGCSGDGRDSCAKRLKDHATIVEHEKGAGAQVAAQLHARMLAAEKKYDEAERSLAENCSRLPDPVSCNIDRVGNALQLNDPTRFEEAASAYIAAACANQETCANAHTWIGNLEFGRSNYISALSRYERAALESPSPEAWLKVADVAIRLGRVGRTETALAAAQRVGAGERHGLAAYEKRLLEMQRAQLLHDTDFAARPKPQR